MNCPRCGNNILQGENKCSKCGLIFINSDINQESIIQNINNDDTTTNSNTNNNQNNLTTPPDNIQTNQQNFPQGEPINLEGYYVGKNYIKIKKRKISWNTLIFGFLYTLYRKSILLSLIWIAIDIASIYIMGKYSIFIIIGLNIVMSFLYNYIYLSIADTKVNNIKRKYWGHSIDELIYRCSQKGGTSGLPLFFFGFACVVSCIVAFLIYLAFYPQYYVDKLYYRVPSDFEVVTTDKESFASYQYSDNINFCGIESKIISNYDSIEKYIEDQTINYNEEDIKISQKNILGKEWTYVIIDPNNNTKNYYSITQKGDKIYSYEYKIYNDFGKKCGEYYNYIKYSMTVR